MLQHYSKWCKKAYTLGVRPAMITILHHLRHLRITIETTVVFILWMVLGQCSAALAAIDRGALLTLHNQARTAAGLSELSLSDPLTTAAQNKTNDMLADQYFAHTSPDGITPWNWIRGAGYVYDGAGEISPSTISAPLPSSTPG